MQFSYNWIQSFFKEKLPKPKELADLIMMHTLEVEEVQKKGSDWILDIDVLPDRMPDCSSHIGIAREISAILGYKIKQKNYPLVEDKNLETKDSIGVIVKDKNLCPRYCARVIEGVKVGQSPKWLKERLKVCGLQSINNIVDATNYVLLETGQPLHAFDAKKLNGKIIIRKAKKGEKMTTFEDKKYILDSENLVIADETEPIAMAGIKGGKKAEIDNKTKKIIIESANFDGKSVYKTSKNLKLKTDASVRFAAGIDSNLTANAIDQTVSLIQTLAGGKITKGIVDVYPKKTLSKKINLNLDRTSSYLGVEISQNQAIKILNSLGFLALKKSKNLLAVTVPTIRRDISIEEDLIEEVGRIYGYEKLPTRFSILETSFPKENKELVTAKKIRETMKAFGFNETYNYSFMSAEDVKIFEKDKKELIETENPISSNTQYLRPSLVPNILKAIRTNDKKFEDIKIFEIGNVFSQKEEKRDFAAAITGKDSFYKIKGIFNFIIKDLEINNVSYVRLDNKNYWERGVVAEIKFGAKKLGYIGEISKRIINFYQIKKPVFVFEVSLKEIISASSEEKEYVLPPIYPAIIQDISVVVSVKTQADEIRKVICNSGGEVVKDIEIFDVYEGSPLAENEKNISFHIFYQSDKKTLTSKEVEKIQEKIIKEIEKNPQWKVRK